MQRMAMRCNNNPGSHLLRPRTLFPAWLRSVPLLFQVLYVVRRRQNCHHHHLVTIITATISRQPGCDPYLSFFGLLFSFIIITVIVIIQVTIRPKWYCLGAQIDQPDLRGWTSDHVFADHFLHVGDDGHHKYMTIIIDNYRV